MDQGVLVTVGHEVVRLLDGAGIKPRAAMWVHTPDTNLWRLWIVPHTSIVDKREFYRRMSEIVSANRDKLSGFDASDTEFVSDTHPAIQALRRIARVTNEGTLTMSSSTFNGFFLPDTLIVEMDFPDASGRQQPPS